MRIAIIADFPVWCLPNMEKFPRHFPYATWFEPLIPEFSGFQDLEINWITASKGTDKDLLHRAHNQNFHILARGSKAVQMATGYIGECRRIRKVIRRIQPDLVHAWGSEDVHGIAGAFSGVDRRIFTLQGCLTEYQRLLGGSILFRLQTIYEKPTINRYHIATAESPAAADLLRVINPSLNISLVEYGVSDIFFKAIWNPSEMPEILFIGTINNRKGISDLIEAASSPDLAHVKIKIIGQGELSDQLKAISKSNVEWIGKCERLEIIKHLETAWSLVIPTYSDTGPTVIKEARVVGLPVITTTGAGASSYIQSSKCGLVISPGDIDGLKSAILEICSDRNNCIQLGKSGWQTHRKELHPSSTAAKFIDLYRRVM
jgi:glycosyltransferase involved in cell wall biosynthesis